ncbi:MAG TPA: hypothetical protein DCS55_08240 [Acidimicrobiaceae bacterium]|nr:hypothetical protein [Acidimicrobiaceae bacterium]
MILRERLADAALALRSAMNRIPEPIDTIDDTVSAMDLALRSLSDAEAATRALADLDAATTEGALLVRSSTASLSLIRSALALLFAELDAAA